MSVDVLLSVPNLLGENPTWCTRRARLYWIDIQAPALMSCGADGGDLTIWKMPEVIGCFALCRDDAFIVALRSGMYRFTPLGNKYDLLLAADKSLPQHRYNEGKCDPRGRFWFGTMNDVVREPTGGLFHLDASLQCTQVEGAIAVPNGLAWSPDEKTMYFADTGTRLIHAYDFDADTGQRGPARVFVDLRKGPGRPDGATVDADGCLWGAEVDSGRVVRYAPDGRELLAVQLPVTRVTCMAFGGADLRTLFITTARQKLTDDELRQQPHAGALFAMQAPVAGVPAAVFAG